MVEDLMSRSMRGFQRSQKHLEKQAFKSTWARPSPNPIFRPNTYNIKYTANMCDMWK